jgi:nucleoside-triphosphatase
LVKLLIEGRPGSGKTTVARRLLTILSESAADVAGFTTAEIRQRGRRVGFSIETIDGRTGILAHVDFDGPRVGKYGVDLKTFESLVLPALKVEDTETIVVIDELGKMELLSEAFRHSVDVLFERDNNLVATVHVYRHPFTERLKQRPATEVVKVTTANRNDLPQDIASRLLTH